MNRPIRRVALGLFLVFLILIVDLTYWQTIAADPLRQHPMNPRPRLALSGRQRGQIISSDTEVLARSVSNPADPRRSVRQYPHGALYAHTVGFSSPLLGDSGLEGSEAEVLASGRDLTVSGLIETLLGEDRRARSIQITLNHRLQRTAARALGDRYGAVVAIEPSSGQLLALVSSPSFDPGSLIGPEAAAAWERLGQDHSSPLRNRATGRSLPGNLLPEDLRPASLGILDTGNHTALSLAWRTATVAGGGRITKPYVVARVVDPDSTITFEAQPTSLDPPLGGEEVAALRDSMSPLTVESARYGLLHGLGHSGTDTDASGRPRIWFAGFLPLGQPLIAVSVVIEPVAAGLSGDPGTAEVASIGRAVIAAWLDQLEPSGP